MAQGIFSSLTEDHTVTNELVKLGKIKREQLSGCIYRGNVLTRAFGHEPHIVIDHTEIALAKGAWFLLCTNVLSIRLSDDEISQVLSQCASADQACKKLLKDAMQAGLGKFALIVVHC